MKVLLIQPPHNYGGQVRPPSYFPLGLGYISKSLLDEKHDVEVFDIYAHQLTNKQVLEKIPLLEYDVVGISAICTQYHYVKWLSFELKKHHNKPIILGGALSTLSTDIVLKHTAVDICIIGDGEITINEVLKNINNLKKVKGIVFKQNKKIIKNKPREEIKNLDSIGFPAWDLFSMDIYINTPSYSEGGALKDMNIMTARGCPYNCNYCSKQFKGVRLRSAENIAKEVKELQKRYGIGSIMFSEELMMVSKKRMYDICRVLKPLNIKWICAGRINVVDFDLLKTMKDAGCQIVGYGIESGSQTILDNMNKNTTVEMGLKAVELTKKAGLGIAVQLMYGYPGETVETIKETIEFCKKAAIQPRDEFSCTTPLPNTQLYRGAIEKGLIKDEEKYLDNLSGYTTGLVMNCTDFDDKEYVRLRKEMENVINRNYILYRRKHPIIFLKEYIFKFQRAYAYYKLNGLKDTLKKIYQFLRYNPNLIFQAEYK